MCAVTDDHPPHPAVSVGQEPFLKELSKMGSVDGGGRSVVLCVCCQGLFIKMTSARHQGGVAFFVSCSLLAKTT